MPSSRILVAVSTPWASERLLGMVRDLAERLGASVIVAHVGKASEQDETDQEAKSRAKQTLAGFTSRLAEAKIPTEGLLLYGADVARAILNAAEAQHATLIVVGLTARGRLSRWLAGDVPQQILRASPVPVLLCPTDWSGTV
jgi:nucleotide-binding universal stress UspA family protein